MPSSNSNSNSTSKLRVFLQANDDLEILENLKAMIKNGQHEIYQAIPKPAVLAALYQGPLQPGQSQVPPHPEQVSADLPGTSRRSTPLSTGSKRDTSSNKPGSDSRNLPELKLSTDSEDKSRIPGDGSTSDIKTDRSPGEFRARQALDTTSPNKSTAYDPAKDDDASRLSRENSWERRDALDDRRGRYDDRNGNLPPPSRSSTYDNRPSNGTGNGPDSRFPPADRRFLDRDREKDRERFGDRERDRDWERDRPDPTRDIRDRDRDRDARDTRRAEFFGRSYGRSHAPRPPPEQRHYEPSYGADYVPPPRRHDVDDKRGVLRSGSFEGRPPPFDDRRPPPPAGADDRRLSIDDRPMRPPPGPESRALLPSSEDRSSRLPLSSDDPVAITRTGADDDRGARATSLVADERPARTTVPLEERISQPAPTPSLQDRLSQPGPVVPTRVDIARQPSLEERLSHGSVPAAVTGTAGGAAASDRATLSDSSRTSPLDAPRTAALSDRQPVNDRFARPVTPPGRTYARSSSVARDDLRPPPPKDDLRDRDRISDFRPGRDLSRERQGGPPPPTSSSYRSDLDRSFGDRDIRDRRELDVDAPAPSARFGDPLSRAGPPLPPRRYSPPPALDRERERSRGIYLPRSPPPLRGGEGAYDPDGDRRYAGDRDRDAYEQRRRDWYGPGDDDKRGPIPPPPPVSWRPFDRPAFGDRDRDRFDRDRDRDIRDRERDRDRDLGPPPSLRANWDDRDRRGPAFPLSPPSRMDNNGIGAARSLSARLTDPYAPPGAGAADDRAYPPPREFDRPRYGALDDHPLPFSRVRGRSPSPPPRRVLGGLSDDLRPPLKRAREDGVPPYWKWRCGWTREQRERVFATQKGRGDLITTDYPSGPPPRSAGTPPPPSSWCQQWVL
ncbi:hypothetical protein BU15DRAFT_73119 [Melanogaster broomeanus]|nr:hypothetical protein BU15DRAFT_73119 [Melanogaster broomeanus]